MISPMPRNLKKHGILMMKTWMNLVAKKSEERFRWGVIEMSAEELPGTYHETIVVIVITTASESILLVCQALLPLGPRCVPCTT